MSHSDTAPGAQALPRQRKPIAPFIAMEVMSRANALEAQGRSIIHLEVGQPSLPAPPRAMEAAERAMRQGRIGYTEALGIPRLRRALAAHYADAHGLSIPPERIAVTTGSSGGFLLAFLANFGPGARVALPTPGYPAYRNILAALDMQVVEFETRPEGRWAPEVERIAQEHRREPLAGLLLASPANPSGTVIEPQRLREIAAFCKREGIVLIVDEIYHGLTYHGPAETVLGAAPEAIVVNSFSKYFRMTGWRVGWLVLPEGQVRSVERLAQSLFISVPTLSQEAAVGALESHGELATQIGFYERNRALLGGGLERLGFGEILPMDGAFYAYAELGPHGADSMAFCRAMLEEAGVAATPGLDFDPACGHRYVRFSYAGAHEEIEEALRRLDRWLSRK